MTNRWSPLSKGARWRLLVDAAKKAATENGYTISRVPGRGLSNVWDIEKDGETRRACIRTTQDRWLAFPPLNQGTKWKTLDEVEIVIVAAVDSRESPENIEVYILPAEKVRGHFDRAYAARINAGHVVVEDFGMWVSLDTDPRNIASSIGSGIVANERCVAVYSIEAVISRALAEEAAEDEAHQPDLHGEASEEITPLMTIADVMAWARERVAEIAGVRAEAVKFDLKVEY